MKSQPAAPAWAKTTSLDIGAAVSVLGITVTADLSEDRASGRGWKTLLLGLESVPHEALGVKPIEGDSDPLPSHKTKAVLGLLRNGMLAKEDPHHPVLDVLRACAARDSLMQWIRTGDPCRMAKAQGSQRYMLIPGGEAESVRAQPPGYMTRDLKMAACLICLGCILVKLGGSPGSTEFYFAVSGYGIPPVIPGDLGQAYRSKRLHELEPEHPLLWMMQGLSNRDAIADHLNRKKKLVLIRAPGSGRASLVSENVKGRTMDRVKKHLGIV